jgi:dTMP kinase
MGTSVKGKFITIEGVEGVGKSTNIANIEAFLSARGIEYVKTREPGGTVIAEKIRELLLDPTIESMSELTELLLVFAARAEHLEKVIQPALNKGLWVLCDRFTDATFAYQGGGRELSLASIETLQDLVQGELRPDLTVILDLDPEVGLARARVRGELDRFENEAQAFFLKVRAAYLSIAAANPERCLVIDAGQSLEQVKLTLETSLASKLAYLGISGE